MPVIDLNWPTMGVLILALFVTLFIALAAGRYVLERALSPLLLKLTILVEAQRERTPSPSPSAPVPAPAPAQSSALDDYALLEKFVLAGISYTERRNQQNVKNGSPKMSADAKLQSTISHVQQLSKLAGKDFDAATIRLMVHSHV